MVAPTESVYVGELEFINHSKLSFKLASKKHWFTD